MLHQMAKSAIWQDKKLSRNTSKKTKTYLLFERELSESSFEVEMGLCSANLFIIPDNIIHSTWIIVLRVFCLSHFQIYTFLGVILGWTL